jgi:hypothetical protein
MIRCDCPVPYWDDVPFVNMDTGHVDMHESPVLLTQEVLAYYIKQAPTILSSWIPTPTHAVSNNAQHWCNSFANDIRSMIPLGVHGDGVPFASNMKDSLESISWHILTYYSGLRLHFSLPSPIAFLQADKQ